MSESHSEISTRVPVCIDFAAGRASPSRGVMPFHVPHTFSQLSKPSPLKSAYCSALVWSLLQRSPARVVFEPISLFKNTEGYSSTDLAMGFANARAGTWYVLCPFPHTKRYSRVLVWRGAGRADVCHSARVEPLPRVHGGRVRVSPVAPAHLQERGSVFTKV